MQEGYQYASREVLVNEDVLVLAQFACKNIKQAIGDMLTAQKRKVMTSEFDLIRYQIDLEHYVKSIEWLEKERQKLEEECQKLGEDEQESEKRRLSRAISQKRELLENGYGAVLWFRDIGDPALSFSFCCAVIEDALRLTNSTFFSSEDTILTSDILREKILKYPRKMKEVFNDLRLHFNDATLLYCQADILEVEPGMSDGMMEDDLLDADFSAEEKLVAQEVVSI